MRSGRASAAVVAAGVLLLAGCGEDGAESADGGAAGEVASSEREGAAEAGSVFDFTATTLDGEEFEAAELSGRPAVFWFWAPWCSTCVAEAPHVLDLAAEHGDAVSIVGVAGLGQPSEMENFVELTDTASLTHLNDESGAVWRHFGVTQQSTFAVVSASGERVAAGYFSPEELAEQVAELVG